MLYLVFFVLLMAGVPCLSYGLNERGPFWLICGLGVIGLAFLILIAAASPVCYSGKLTPAQHVAACG